MLDLGLDSTGSPISECPSLSTSAGRHYLQRYADWDIDWNSFLFALDEADVTQDIRHRQCLVTDDLSFCEEEMHTIRSLTFPLLRRHANIEEAPSKHDMKFITCEECLLMLPRTLFSLTVVWSHDWHSRNPGVRRGTRWNCKCCKARAVEAKEWIDYAYARWQAPLSLSHSCLTDDVLDVYI